MVCLEPPCPPPPPLPPNHPAGAQPVLLVWWGGAKKKKNLVFLRSADRKTPKKPNQKTHNQQTAKKRKQNRKTAATKRQLGVVRIELTTSGLWDQRSNRLSHTPKASGHLLGGVAPGNHYPAVTTRGPWFNLACGTPCLVLFLGVLFPEKRKGRRKPLFCLLLPLPLPLASAEC